MMVMILDSIASRSTSVWKISGQRINELAAIAMSLEQKQHLDLCHDLRKPQGRGRNSDITLVVRELLDEWSPRVALRQGLRDTFFYFWIKSQIEKEKSWRPRPLPRRTRAEQGRCQ
eukprot:GEZU01039028.1.p2 GENE.GEZU01039028.1~~GEZU01039028.1.p2  ORF type:complete len:116 (+),score=12.43 GEZU01039028.1:169-516(+)